MRRRLALATAVLLFAAGPAGSSPLAWAPGGVRVATTAGGTRWTAAAVSDATGGAVVFFEETNPFPNPNTRLAAQHFDSSGARLWGDGVLVTSSCSSGDLRAIADGAGGTIVAWEDRRDDPAVAGSVAVQRLDATGTPLWDAEGVILSHHDDTESAMQPAVCSDGAGGAIVAWTRAGGSSSQIRAQRVDASGTTRWSTFGIVVCDDHDGTQRAVPDVTSDSTGGVYVAWEDKRQGGYQSGVYVTRIDSSGVRRSGWTEDGNPATTATAPAQSFPHLAPDGAGGVIAAWRDRRAGSLSPAVWGQRFAADATPLWDASDGKVLVADLGGGSGPSAVTALEAGSFALVYAWGEPTRRSPETRIEAQKFGADGTALWNAGVPLVVGDVRSSASDTQDEPSAAPDGSGGIVVSWTDWRAGVHDSFSNSDVYAQRVLADGSLATGGPEGVAISAVPGTNQGRSSVVGDGAGGAIVAWTDALMEAPDAIAQRWDGSTGPSPRAGFVLPTRIVRKVDPRFPIEGRVTLSATLDTGPDAAAFSPTAALAVGALRFPITDLARDPKGVWRASSPELSLAVVPSAIGSSRCRMTAALHWVGEPALAADGPLDLTLVCGNVGATGGCELAKGAFALGRGRLPFDTSVPRSAKATLVGPGRDSFTVKWAISPGAPRSPFPDIVFAFGPVYSKTIPGSAFRKKGRVHAFKDRAGALPTMTLDTRTGFITVTGRKADLGTFADGAQGVRFTAGPVDEPAIVDVRMVREGRSLRY